MSKEGKEETFDVNQGHGDHNETVNGYATSREFLAECLPKAIQEADMVLSTKTPMTCSVDGEAAVMRKFFLLGAKDAPARLMAILACNESAKTNELYSVYPECDGAEVEVRLTDIHEWAAGYEATLEGTVLGDAERAVAFFDTRYILNKERYVIGETYKFRMAAFAYDASVLPEEERKFRMEGEKAAECRKRMGKEPEFDENGNVKPLIFHMDEMVAFFQQSRAYPDDAEFQSPVFDDPVEFDRFGTSFYKLTVAIARDDEDVRIPLVAKKALFAVIPKKSDPIRGRIWVQGYLAGSDKV